MADNRNFVNKFANQGGGDIFVEDAKLSEISTKTAIASEGVMLKGTDGAYYEIDKASLSEVIRAELGAILADNSKNNGTSVGKVPTLNSSGNALGASSVADLASVLGGSVTTVAASSSDDLNNYTTPKNIFFDSGAQGLPANKPAGITSSFWLKVEMPVGQRIVQTVISPLDGSTFRRIKDGSGSWQNWIRVDSFGCATASDLASALGVNGKLPGEVRTITSAQDLNDLTTNGWYTVTDINANNPSGVTFGQVIVFNSGAYKTQIIINGEIYFRVYIGGWNSWKKII